MISYIDGEYRGLAADLTAMDTSNLRNMEKFVVADEGKVSYWDLENQTWVDFVVPASDADNTPDTPDAPADPDTPDTPDNPADNGGEG